MKKNWLIILGLVALGSGTAFLFSRQSGKVDSAQSQGNIAPASSSSEKRASDNLNTSLPDAQRAAQTAESGSKIQETGKRDPLDPGTVIPVRADANAQVRSVAEALKSKAHPERLSTLVKATPFNRQAYLENPSTYCGVAEPGRIWDVAPPSKDTPRLLALSERMQNVKQGGSVSLKLKTVSKMPVSLVALDGGMFENKLNTITVAADEAGVAEVKFFGTPGTINEVNILAASPVASGQVKFLVNVEQ